MRVCDVDSAGRRHSQNDPQNVNVKRVCLAYSGGLDTSVILHWLIHRPMVAKSSHTPPTSGRKKNSPAFRKRPGPQAQSTVWSAICAKSSPATSYFPAIKGAAIYEGTYLLGTALARPLIAKHHAEVAIETGCDAVAHGATGKGNDQVRFELTFRALAPELHIIAPWREWDIRSRSDCFVYCEKYGIPVTATLEKPYSIDRNLMHISYEGGVLEDPGARLMNRCSS